MFRLTCGEYSVDAVEDGIPGIHSEYAHHARLCVEVDLHGGDGKIAYCAVSRGSDWPFMTVAFRYAPSGAGFNPGAMLIPETDRLFLGAGTLLLAFDLRAPRQIWEDVAQVGFWSWARHEDTVLMSAELELAAWDLQGRKLWTTFVEPPWGYTVEKGSVTLDVMGRVTEFPLRYGPGARDASRR